MSRNYNIAPITVLADMPVDTSRYVRVCVGAIIKTKDGKILVQQRDQGAPRCASHLGTFGGGLDAGETPINALLRELNEELGAVVNPADVIALGIIEDASVNYLIIGYFWHDAKGAITGCHEGFAAYYDNVQSALVHPMVMYDLQWELHEARTRGFVK